MPRVPDIALLPVQGDLDVTSAPRLRAAIDALVEGGCRRVILNMARTTRVDSAGMGLIFLETRRLRGLGGVLSLDNVPPDVYRALCVACVVDLIPVSQAGSRRPAPVLDPSVRPLWRRSLRVDPARLSEARSWVERMLSGVALTSDEVFDMTLASGEALGNAIDHACCAEGVSVTVTSYPDRVVAEVSDCGTGFELAADEEPTPERGGEERGRGIRLMRLLADSVSIRRKQVGEGTVVSLVKMLRPDARAPRRPPGPVA